MSLLTKSGGFLGPIATVLGYVMSGIFALLVAINIPNIGLAIILFTIVIYMLMLPLTYRQQKFSRMTPLMNPELNAIRDKYKGKQDQASMQRMNEETQMVYAKYGVNPAGSCVQLAIQMLILFPLYRVIMNIPAYVPQVKEVFVELAGKLLTTTGAEKYLTEIAKSIQAMTITKSFTENTIIDTLYKFRPANWTGLAEQFPELSDIIAKTQKTIGGMNNFLGLDIANMACYCSSPGSGSRSRYSVDLCQAFHGRQYAAGRNRPDGRHHEDHEQCHASDVRILLPDSPCRYGHLLDHVRSCAYGPDLVHQ